MLDARLEEIVESLRWDSAQAPLDALRQMLSDVVAAEGVIAGLVWLVDDLRQLIPCCDVGMQELAEGRQFALGPAHGQRLAAALQEGQVACLTLDEAEQPPKRRCGIALGPVFRGPEPRGLVELFVEEGLSDADRRRLVSCVEALCGLAARIFSPAAVSQPDAVEFLKQLGQFTLNLQRSLAVDEVAAVAAHDARVLLGCDRVSVAIKRGDRAIVQAVSGQDRVNRRANLIRSMADLAGRVMAAGEPVTYCGELDGFPQRLQEPLSEYVGESGSRMVILVPLHESPPLTQENESLNRLDRRKPARVIGCLIVEQTTETQPRAEVTGRLDPIADHVAAALTNARRHSSVFLLPMWRALGRGVDYIRGRRRWIAIAVVAGVVVVAGALALVPWEYRVEADGKVMPVMQRDVFAPWDGEVVEVQVEGGDPVDKGRPLLRLENDELDAELIAARNLSHEKRKQRDTLIGQLQTVLAGANRDEQRRIEGELAQVRIELAAAEKDERILAERIAKLTVTAPITGVIATHQLRQSLLNRPVRRGEVLMEVMEADGPWQLELQVPDHRMGHLLSALRRSESQQVRVEFVTAAAVEQTFEGTLSLADVATRSEQHEETGTTFEAIAHIDVDDLPHRRIGADVTAKIDCGRTSLGYALFGDVVEFLQRHLWW